LTNSYSEPEIPGAVPSLTNESIQPAPAFLSAIQSLFGKRARLDAADLLVYGYDNSRRETTPHAVCFAQNHSEVRALVELCAEYEVPLTTRGLGSGTTGAAVPVNGGVVLSTERFDGLVKVDPENRLAIVEPGITNAVLQEALAKHGFFWPPDPTSAAYSTVGGNLACNAAGPRAIKYGTPRDNTLGLIAVTGEGKTIKTGVCTSKGVVGYDLTRLLVGSEGTLAIITQATLRIVPLPESSRLLRAVYGSLQGATSAVANIMAQPETPSALEFMDPVAVSLVRDYAEAGLPDRAAAVLLIEVDGNKSGIEQVVKCITAAAANEDLVEIRAAENEVETAALWACRKSLSPALRKIAPKKINEDVVVPVTRLTELVSGLQELSAQYDVQIVSFGHAGNGNLHVNLLGNPSAQGELQRMETCLQELFSLVLGLDGTLSGEHGIGLEKRQYVSMEIEPNAMQLMQQIKLQFDPKNILNPGKLFPDP